MQGVHTQFRIHFTLTTSSYSTIKLQCQIINNNRYFLLCLYMHVVSRWLLHATQLLNSLHPHIKTNQGHDCNWIANVLHRKTIEFPTTLFPFFSFFFAFFAFFSLFFYCGSWLQGDSDLPFAQTGTFELESERKPTTNLHIY